MKRKKDSLFWLGVVYLVGLLLLILIYPFVGADPEKMAVKPWLGPGEGMLLGSDQLGRDVFARLVHGASNSLKIGFAVQGLSLLLGVIIGSIGVFAPRWLGNAVMRFTDGMFAFPDLLLATLIIAVKGPGFDAVIIALSVTSWPSIARIVFTQVSSLKDREFVIAAKAMGASTPYSIVKHILPQIYGILLAVSVVDLAATILAESTLSFLGIGIRPPAPSLGNMIDMFRLNMNAHPVHLIWPCLALSITIFALNFVGDGLRWRLDPRNR